MTARGAAPGVRQSECSRCPKWVLRCSHLDGEERVVWVWHAKYSDSYFASMGRPDVQVYPNSIGFTPIPGKWDFVATRAEADAAFARFEAQLLGREEAS